jgi:hypothetical protein
MKKVLFAFALLFGAAAAVNAQDTTQVQDQEQSTQYNDQDQERDKDMTPIATSELPAAVRTSLESQDYSGWTVSNAFKKDKDGQTVYAVELKNGAETKKVKFDAQGNKLKEKDKKDDQK